MRASEANKIAWENLKKRFIDNCLDKEGWSINETYHTISHVNGIGVTSISYPFWRNSKNVIWTKS